MSRHLHATVDSQDPLIKAAYEVAKHAHASQRRGKALPADKDPYLVHPVMVYELLQAMGEDDPVMLAAGLLHDTIEDYAPYDAHPLRMKTDLIKALQAHGYTGNAEKMANEVYVIVQELTKPKELIEGSKRITQVVRANHMQRCAKIIKIADQTCSLIDHLMMANDPAMFPKHKAAEFAIKAHNLVQAILHSSKTLEERLEIAPWFALFHFVNTNNKELLNAPTQAEIDAIRKAFDRPVAEILKMNPQYEVHVAKKVPMQLDKTQEFTLAHVNLDAFGNVQNFVLWVNPTGDAKDARNTRQKEFLDALERYPNANVVFGQRRYVRFGDGTNAEEGRIHYLEPHIPLADFLPLARQAKIVGEVGSQKLRAAVTEIQQTNDRRVA